MVLRLLKTVIETYRSDGCVGTLRKSLRHIYNKKIPVLIRWIQYTTRYLKYYDTTPKATNILYVQPESVEYVVWPGFYSELSSKYTFIRDGTWDQSIVQSETGHWNDFDQRLLIPFEEYTPYISFVQHFQNGVPWEETDYFKQAVSDPMRNRLGTVNSPRWEKFEEWDDLYKSLKKDGYKFEKTRFMSYPSDEILIDIGRDGQLILDDGRHRFMIAKILGIDKVPVRVLVRHEQWQNKKISILSTEKSIDCLSDLSDHPDLPQTKQD